MLFVTVYRWQSIDDWCWSWSWISNTWATWCKQLTHWKRPWCWEKLKAGGEGDDRGWDGWMASPTRWTWVWASSGNWWWTGKPDMLQSMVSESQTRLSNWTELNLPWSLSLLIWKIKLSWFNWASALPTGQWEHQVMRQCFVVERQHVQVRWQEAMLTSVSPTFENLMMEICQKQINWNMKKNPPSPDL